MVTRLVSLLVLLAAGVGLVALAPPAEAAGLPLSPQLVLLSAAAPDGATETDLDQRAIFDILCGGMTLRDPDLQAHLWRVAGSLAARHWTPPKVTVRVVVKSAD